MQAVKPGGLVVTVQDEDDIFVVDPATMKITHTKGM